LEDINQMFFLMREAGGLGLAAPQVGISARFFITYWGEVFVNPEIIRMKNPIRIIERCLSFPGITATIQRRTWIQLSDGRIYEDERAFVIQHECDHLNNILIIDR
jgi:peptide deformylase